MYYKLNLTLKSFGQNTIPSVTFMPTSLDVVKTILDGYRPLLVRYELYKIEVESHNYKIGEVLITTRTRILLH